jgi:hypothetical protein
MTKRNPPDEYQKQYPCEVPFVELEDSDKLAPGHWVFIGVAVVAAVYFGAVVVHGVYMWMVS